MGWGWCWGWCWGNRVGPELEGAVVGLTRYRELGSERAKGRTRSGESSEIGSLVARWELGHCLCCKEKKNIVLNNYPIKKKVVKDLKN